MKAGLGLLDARLVAGDAALAAAPPLGDPGRLARARRAGCCPSCATCAGSAPAQVGELAFLLEPDLKEAYGGLREGQVLRAVAAAQLADEPAADARGGLRACCSTSATSCAGAPAAPTTSWSGRSSGRWPTRSASPTRTRCSAR